MKISRYKC